METILHQNSHGVKIVREDVKQYGLVAVVTDNEYGTYYHRDYRFKLVREPIQIPFCSWANLDCCGGWAYDEEYLETAVQKGLKLFAGRTIMLRRKDWTHGPTLEEALQSLDALAATLPPDCCVGYDPESIPTNRLQTYICRTGCIADYIDLDAVFPFYSKLGYKLYSRNKTAIRQYCNIELKKFGTSEAPFDYANPRIDTEYITTGLLLGYPIESTVSILQEMQAGRF